VLLLDEEADDLGAQSHDRVFVLAERVCRPATNVGLARRNQLPNQLIDTDARRVCLASQADAVDLVLECSLCRSRGSLD
jgi:hypothetical protein